MKDESISLESFLLARIAETEQLARAATPGAWKSEAGDRLLAYRDDGWPYWIVAVEPAFEGATAWQYNAAHIARHDPARVLAECKAKRLIVGWYQSLAERMEEVPALEPRHNELGMVLSALAEPYVDHPDYRDRWL